MHICPYTKHGFSALPFQLAVPGKLSGEPPCNSKSFCKKEITDDTASSCHLGLYCPFCVAGLVHGQKEGEIAAFSWFLFKGRTNS